MTLCQGVRLEVVAVLVLALQLVVFAMGPGEELARCDVRLALRESEARHELPGRHPERSGGWPASRIEAGSAIAPALIQLARGNVDADLPRRVRLSAHRS